MALTNKLTAIGNAIRSKTGGSALLSLTEMVSEIGTLVKPTGSLSISTNDTYDVTNYASAVVNVPSQASNEDAIIDRSISGTYTNSTVTAVGNYAFQGCSNLTAISLTAATRIGMNAFFNCSGLTSVNLPAVTEITGMSAFRGCSGLSSITLERVTNIADMAFYNCSGLVTANFPAATEIASSVFYNCTNLTSVSLPVITSIGGIAFSGCTSLTDVSFDNITAAPTCGATIFDGCTNLTNIWVPDGLVNACKSATNLSAYASKIKPISERPSA